MAAKNKTQVETQHLECILTDTEKLIYSKELSEKISNKSRTEDNLKSFSSQAKAEIAGFDARINLLAEKLNTGKEYRPIQVEVMWNYTKGEKTWVRLDTKQIIKTDIIPTDELQQELELK